jgi:very-short-patch-repair endonuclease
MEFMHAEAVQIPSDRRIAALATRQHGVVARWQLLAMGLTRTEIETRLARGTLIAVHRAVYAVGHTKLTAAGRWMAAVLAAGDGAVLSHADAAALHALRTMPTGAIHVTAAGKRRIPGVRVHLDALPRTERTVCDAIAVTTVERTVADLAVTLTGQRLRTVIEAAMRRGVIDFATLGALAGRRYGRAGAPTLRAVLAELVDEAPWTQSDLERDFLELTRAACLPEPRANVVVEGFVVDFHWPVQRVVVETDGYAFHRGRRSFEDDRRKDARLQAAGWRVLRITRSRLQHDAPALAGELRRLLTA